MKIQIDAEKIDHQEIIKYTNNVSDELLIGECELAKLYRGTDGKRNFTVKIFDISVNLSRLLLVDELAILDHRNYKGLPKAISYCNQENIFRAIVYDIDTMDTLHNLITKDTFSWSNRMKVALGTATAIKSIYPYILRNISAAQILCDQNYTVKLCDFGLISGPFFGERWKFDGQRGSRGYTDPHFLAKGECSEKTDVFAFGLVLLGLITKRVVSTEKDTDTVSIDLAESKYKLEKLKTKLPTIVDPSLRSHKHYCRLDSYGTTKLAIRCMASDPNQRPTVEEVVKKLKGLKIFREKHISLPDEPIASK